MPESVIERGLADHVAAAVKTGPLLQRLMFGETNGHHQANPVDPGPDEMELVENRVQLPDGEPSPFCCPQCKGPLWVKDNGSLSHFRCHTGHAFTGEVLADEQLEDVEAALWSGVRALDEQAMLLHRLNERSSGMPSTARR
jgi:two-component system chemotaxis response regulator CheB